jgi:hypothetical protein
LLPAQPAQAFSFPYICAMPLQIASLWHTLDQWDKWLFVQLNGRLTNPFFDAVLPYFPQFGFWAPLYIFLLVFIMLNYGRRGWWWSLGFRLHRCPGRYGRHPYF